MGLISWCAAPIGQNGAYYLYKVFVAPFFRAYSGHIDYYLTHAVNLTKEASAYVAAYSKWNVRIFMLLDLSIFYIIYFVTCFYLPQKENESSWKPCLIKVDHV